MKIVIDIPETVYSEFIAGTQSMKNDVIILNAVFDGTPLPKGHGRLIDSDMFLARNAYFADKDFIDSKYGDTLKDLVDREPTVIEADKEGD